MDPILILLGIYVSEKKEKTKKKKYIVLDDFIISVYL